MEAILRRVVVWRLVQVVISTTTDIFHMDDESGHILPVVLLVEEVVLKTI